MSKIRLKFALDVELTEKATTDIQAAILANDVKKLGTLIDTNSPGWEKLLLSTGRTNSVKNAAGELITQLEILISDREIKSQPQQPGPRGQMM
jgi:hypothetical protein